MATAGAPSGPGTPQRRLGTPLGMTRYEGHTKAKKGRSEGPNSLRFDLGLLVSLMGRAVAQTRLDLRKVLGAGDGFVPLAGLLSPSGVLDKSAQRLCIFAISSPLLSRNSREWRFAMPPAKIKSFVCCWVLRLLSMASLLEVAVSFLESANWPPLVPLQRMSSAVAAQ